MRIIVVVTMQIAENWIMFTNHLAGCLAHGKCSINVSYFYDYDCLALRNIFWWTHEDTNSSILRAPSVSQSNLQYGQQMKMLSPVWAFIKAVAEAVWKRTHMQKQRGNSNSAGKLSSSTGFRHKQWINRDLGEECATQTIFTISFESPDASCVKG